MVNVTFLHKTTIYFVIEGLLSAIHLTKSTSASMQHNTPSIGARGDDRSPKRYQGIYLHLKRIMCSHIYLLMLNANLQVTLERVVTAWTLNATTSHLSTTPEA